MMIVMVLLSIIIIASIVSVDANSIMNKNIGSRKMSSQQRRSLTESWTGSGSASSYMTSNYFPESATCDGLVSTSTNIGGYCITDGTTYWIDSYKSDANNIMTTNTVYQENTCTTVVTSSTQTIPKTCIDLSQVQQSPFSMKIIDAGEGSPKKEHNVILTKDYYSADCSGPMKRFSTAPLDKCQSGTDNGVTISSKGSCHNSTHYKLEYYATSGSCTGTASTFYGSLACEPDGNGQSSNYECVPKEEEKKEISPLVYLAILGLIPILGVVYLFRARLFSSCSGKGSEGKVYVEKAQELRTQP